MEWISANMGTILVGAVVFLILLMAVRQIISDRKKGCNSCGANCSGCSHSCSTQEIPERFKLKNK